MDYVEGAQLVKMHNEDDDTQRPGQTFILSPVEFPFCQSMNIIDTVSWYMYVSASQDESHDEELLL